MRKANRLAIDSLLAVLLSAAVVCGVTLYPRIPALWSEVTNPEGVGFEKAAAAVSKPALPPKAPALRAEIEVAFVRLHAAPSANAATVARLSRHTQVVLLEQRGAWERIHVDAGAATAARDGWLHATALKRLPPR